MPDQVRNIAVLPLSRLSRVQLAEWERLVRGLELTPTHLPGWIDLVARASSAADSVEVVTAEHGDGAGFFIPVFRSKSRQLGMALHAVELATNRVCYHSSLPCDDGLHTEALAAMLHATAPWEVFRASGFVEGSDSERALLSVAESRGLRYERLANERSPYLTINTGWDEYLATRPKKFRYKLRRRQSDLEDSDSLRLERFEAADKCGIVLDAMFEVEAKSWKAEHGLDIPSSARERPYYTALLPYLASLDALRAIVLYDEQKPIAYSLCCHWNGWYGHLKTSFDTAYSERSPGGMVIDHSIQDAFAEGAREFDFLGDQDRHKAHWSRDVRTHYDYVLYAPSIRPRLLHLAKKIKKAVIGRDRKASVKPD